MMNGQDTAADPQDTSDCCEIELPVKKKPRRTKNLAYRRKKNAHNQKSSSSALRESSSSAIDNSESQKIRSTVNSKAASRKPTNAQLQNELRHALSDNARLQSLLDEANRQLAASKTKRVAATAALQASQAKARDFRKSLTKSESVAWTQAKQLSIAEEYTQAIVQEATEKERTKHEVSCAYSLPFLFTFKQITVYLCFRKNVKG
jgi:hypothetical protein